MSYEGYREFLCANGHYDVCDAYDDDPTFCRVCSAPMAFRHSVDQTNGPDDENPGTLEAPKELIAEDDEWKEDHHGNRYATQVRHYRPLGEWRAMSHSQEKRSSG